MPKSSSLSLLLACCAALGFGAARADAAIIHVAPGEVIVNAGNGRCSLREAINNANAGSDTSGGDCTAGDAGADEIILASHSLYTLLDFAESSADFGQSGLPAITSTIDIKGNGATIERSATLFSGDDRCDSTVPDSFRLFFIDTTGVLTLENVALHNGCASFADFTGAGGAIFCRGSVTLIKSTVSANTARQSGGAIHNDGTLELIKTTVRDNLVIDGAGGGVVSTSGFRSVQSTLSGNTTPGAGGALLNTTDGTAELGNDTLSQNLSAGTGGGFQNEGTAALTNVTITANTGLSEAADPASSFGGGIFSLGALTIGNTIVVNQAKGTDCSGSVSSLGHNLDSDGSCAGVASDITSTTPRLGPLANNGGPTQTHALLAGSPAIDHGDNPMCAADPVNNVDQRGVSRPLNGGISLTCDIGAFELCLGCAARAAAPAVSAPMLVGLACLLLVAGAYRSGAAERARLRARPS